MKFHSFFCLTLVSTSQSLKAHDPGFSLAVLTIGENSIEKVVIRSCLQVSLPAFSELHQRTRDELFVKVEFAIDDLDTAFV